MPRVKSSLVREFTPPLLTSVGVFWTRPIRRGSKGCAMDCPLWDRCVEAVRRGDPVGCEFPLEKEIPGREEELVAAIREQILAIAATNGVVTAVGLRRTLRGIRYDLLARALHELEEEGLLQEERDGKGHRIGRKLCSNSR